MLKRSDKSGKDARCRAPTPPIDSPLHHHPLRPSRLGKIVLSNQQVALLGDPWRVAKPGANHVQRELVLEFCLPAGSPLLKRNRVEQSGPTLNAGARP
jgi:hypothetical protein